MHTKGSPCLMTTSPRNANTKSEARWFVRLIAGAVLAAHKSPLAAHKLKITSGSTSVYTPCNPRAINGRLHFVFPKPVRVMGGLWGWLLGLVFT